MKCIKILLTTFILSLIMGVAAVNAQDALQWIPAQISARQEHAVAASADTAFVFGGVGESSQAETYFNDLWQWNEQGWQLLTMADLGPSPRAESAIVFDIARDELLLYGGWNGVTELGDTWIWNGTIWQQPQISVAPPALRDHAIVYDAARGEMILFGGRSSTESNSTWRWRNGNWEEVLTDNAPPPMTHHSMAYDFARGRVVLFGGRSNGELLGELWEWDGNEWHEITQSNDPSLGPAQRARHILASADDGVLLFGGSSVDGQLSDTWRWNGSTWTRFAPQQRPTARTAAAGAYLPARNATLLFGGQSVSGYSGDTWLWRDQSWQMVPKVAAPNSRSQHAMVYDSARDETVLFGGVVGFSPVADTWIWDGDQWQIRAPIHSPTSRFGHTMVYDAAREQTVLFGGHDEYARNDLWVWDGVDWQNQYEDGLPNDQAEPRPRRRWGHAMVYDELREEVVLFGGSRDEAGFFSDTWVLDGTQWTERTDALRPPPRRGHAMIYDAASLQVLLFGGYHVDGDTATYYNDTWAWRDGSWRKIEIDNSPPGRFGHTLLYDPQRQQILLIGGSGDPTTADQEDADMDMDVVWAWADGTWQALADRVPVAGMAHHAAATHGACQALIHGGLNALTTPTSTWFMQDSVCNKEPDNGFGDDDPSPDVTENSWTMMLYLAGDTVLYDGGLVYTHLQRAINRVEQQMLAAGVVQTAQDEPTINIVALLDGPEDGDAQMITFTPEATYVNMGELAMDASETLQAFIVDAQTQFPAEHYYLAITDHANGVEGIAWDTTSDFTGNALLTPSEIRTVLQAVTDNGNNRIDVIHYDGCSFGLLENASIADGYADYIIASQNTGWGAFAYERYFEAIGPQTTPEQMATSVAVAYAEVVTNHNRPYTISVLDLSGYDEVMLAFEGFTQALQSYASRGQGNLSQIDQIRKETQAFDSDGDLELTLNDDYIDLADFAARVRAQIDDVGLADQAQQVIDSIDEFVAYEDHLSGPFEYFGTPRTWALEGAHGVGIYYPNFAGGDAFSAYIAGTTFPNFHNRSTWHEFLSSGVPALSNGGVDTHNLPPLGHLMFPESVRVHLPLIYR